MCCPDSAGVGRCIEFCEVTQRYYNRATFNLGEKWNTTVDGYSFGGNELCEEGKLCWEGLTPDLTNYLIWVPQTGHGTIARINAETLSYSVHHTGVNGGWPNTPGTGPGASPSRTSVNAFTGEVWVANRGYGGSGPNASGVAHLRPDGSMRCYYPMGNPHGNPASVARSLQVDPNGDAWVGDHSAKKYLVISGSEIDESLPYAQPPRCKKIGEASVQGTPYGAFIDADGVLWSQDTGEAWGVRVEKVDLLTRMLSGSSSAAEANYGISGDHDNVVFGSWGGASVARYRKSNASWAYSSTVTRGVVRGVSVSGGTAYASTWASREPFLQYRPACCTSTCPNGVYRYRPNQSCCTGYDEDDNCEGWVNCAGDWTAWSPGTAANCPATNWGCQTRNCSWGTSQPPVTAASRYSCRARQKIFATTSAANPGSLTYRGPNDCASITTGVDPLGRIWVICTPYWLSCHGENCEDNSCINDTVFCGHLCLPEDRCHVATCGAAAIRGSSKVYRCNSAGNCSSVSIQPQTDQYVYSDFIGQQAELIQPGTWTITYDSGVRGPVWKELALNADIPPGTRVRTRFRMAATRSELESVEYTDYYSSDLYPLRPEALIGLDRSRKRYIQVELYLSSLARRISPQVNEFAITWRPFPGPDDDDE